MVGFHFTGNIGYNQSSKTGNKFARVDAQGFLKELDQIGNRVNDCILETNQEDFKKRNNESKIRSIVKSRIGREPSFSSLSGASRWFGKRTEEARLKRAVAGKHFEQYDGTLHNCWICERWVEVEFTVDVDGALADENQQKPNGQFQCMIHFDFDFYQPWPMTDLGE